MAIGDAALGTHEEPFPDHVSTLARTDPERLPGGRRVPGHAGCGPHDRACLASAPELTGLAASADFPPGE
ncbi:hypothetical protein MTP10_27650 [Nonomuraea sp. 3-1Str]|uniref:hypothetical protein n=1 Tax=Nonomuraea sp. 3-1Str TaxID=2929801 RepID=UPI0028679BEA|nr:hypothetical protein [Nonomuraea sp. 3-1Str]MDR8412491.1 hypothetical protein [Nonomuraea sp. 3-1Str]